MSSQHNAMTAYQRNVRAWVIIMSVALSIGLLALYVSNWFILPFFGWTLIVPHLLLKGIDCPKCGTPVTYQGTFFDFRIKGGFIRRKCQQCGWDLRKQP
jgi:hypothetical protein